jgi:hypothetical protein
MMQTPDPLDVACPTCAATPGRRCNTGRSHNARFAAARRRYGAVHPPQTALREVSGPPIRLLDDSYTAWRQAQQECHDALRRWLDSGARDHAAYHAYRAALDREQAAAVDLERLTHLVAA